MPKLNGLDLSKALWTMALERPVIIVSGYSEEPIRNNEDERPRYYPSKPLSLKELKEMVAKALSR